MPELEVDTDEETALDNKIGGDKLNPDQLPHTTLPERRDLCKRAIIEGEHPDFQVDQSCVKFWKPSHRKSRSVCDTYGLRVRIDKNDGGTPDMYFICLEGDCAGPHCFGKRIKLVLSSTLHATDHLKEYHGIKSQKSLAMRKTETEEGAEPFSKTSSPKGASAKRPFKKDISPYQQQTTMLNSNNSHNTMPVSGQGKLLTGPHTGPVSVAGQFLGPGAMGMSCQPDASGISADHEEELLLHLLIKRRQRARDASIGGPVRGGITGNPTLGEEMNLMYQGRSHGNFASSLQPAQLTGLKRTAMGAGFHLTSGAHDSANPQFQSFHANSTNGVDVMPKKKAKYLPDMPRRPLTAGAHDFARPQFLSFHANSTNGVDEIRKKNAKPPPDMPRNPLTAGAHDSASPQFQATPSSPVNSTNGSDMMPKNPPPDMPRSQFQAVGVDMIPLKKAKRPKPPIDKPRRPLSAYNIFFSAERERILKMFDKKEGGDGGSTGNDGEAEAASEETEKPEAFTRPIIPAQRKRRPHRKTHGKICFADLARLVGDRWKELSEDHRKQYQEMADEDTKRQREAMEEYKKKLRESVQNPVTEKFIPKQSDSIKQVVREKFIPNPRESIKKADREKFIPNPRESIEKADRYQFKPKQSESIEKADREKIKPEQSESTEKEEVFIF